MKSGSAFCHTPMILNPSFSPISVVIQRSISAKVSSASVTNSGRTISEMFRCMIFCHSLLVTKVSSNMSKAGMTSWNRLSRKKKKASSNRYRESCRRNFLPALAFPFLNSRQSLPQNSPSLKTDLLILSFLRMDKRHRLNPRTEREDVKGQSPYRFTISTGSGFLFFHTAGWAIRNLPSLIPYFPARFCVASQPWSMAFW